MKIRRFLSETDLARIAALPADRRRKELEQIRDEPPPSTYKPLKASLYDIFNVQVGMFGLIEPTSWAVVEKNLSKAARSEEEFESNRKVARGLHDFASTNQIFGRGVQFPSLPLSLVGVKVSYWLNLVLQIDGRPVIPFMDPRRTHRLSPVGRQLVLSIMHEHIRVQNPDYARATLAVVQFGEPIGGRRNPKFYFDDKLEILAFSEIEMRIRDTYDLWVEVLEAREKEARRHAGGAGGTLL